VNEPASTSFTALTSARASIYRRSVWPVLLASLALSIPLHLGLALWLEGFVVNAPLPTQQAVLIETTSLMSGVDAQEPAPVLQPVSMPALPMESAQPQPMQWQTSAIAGSNDATQASAFTTAGEVDAVPSLAPSVSSISASGAAGGGIASTTFFGARATGKRFAFVVDKSGSMNSNSKMHLAVQELLRSVQALPDFAQFRICFFDTSNIVFPERGFRKARAADVQQLASWVTGIRPTGGTMPKVAFDQVMSDGSLPDAIFFMTDGQIPAEDPAWIVRRVTLVNGCIPVNCVAFGDPAAAQQLQMIANATGGQFRFVPVGGGR